MRIAIVDDLSRDREDMAALLRQIGVPAEQITQYDCGESFLSTWLPGSADVVFLDIYMPGMDGMETAERLRKADASCAIVFLTISTEFGVQSYAVHAADYLVKPATRESVLRALNYCRPAEHAEAETLEVSYRRQNRKVPVCSILYVDLDGRTVRIHTKNSVFPVGGTFGEVTDPLLADTAFQPCYRGIVVNLRQVSRLDRQELTLKTGEKLPVSRRCCRNLEEARLDLDAKYLREGAVQ